MSLPAQPRSFWARPEGTAGMVVGVAGVAAAGYAFTVALPLLIALAASTLYLAGMVAVLGAGTYVALDRRTWIVASYAYRNAMRALTGIVVTIDPIGIMRNYVEDLRSHRDEMVAQIKSLRDQMRSLGELITQNEMQRAAALRTAGAAREKAEQGKFVLKARQAGRLEQSNLTLKGLYTKMEILFRVLTKMAETAGYLIDDMQDEIDLKARERKAIRASWTAMRAAQRIMNGDPDKRALFDQGLEVLADDYGQKLGEIEDFVTLSKDFIDSVDLENGEYEADALRTLEEWERKGDSILLGDNKARLIERSYDTTARLDLNAAPARETVPAKLDPPGYSRFFK